MLLFTAALDAHVDELMCYSPGQNVMLHIMPDMVRFSSFENLLCQVEFYYDRNDCLWILFSFQMAGRI